MGHITDVFNLNNGEKYECEDCGETIRLQFGICCECGGDVVEKEHDIVEE